MNGKPILTLKEFIYRRQAIQLYRDMMRTLRHIEDREHRQEMLQWIRHEFIKHKETRDEEMIKILLARGQSALKELETSAYLVK